MDASLTAPSLRKPSVLELVRRHRQDAERLRLCLPLDRRPLDLLGARNDLSVVWRSGDLQCVGFGEASSIVASGQDRYAQLESRAQRLFAGLRTVNVAEAEPGRARLFGGLSFAPGTAASEPWSTFGDCRFVLPRMLLLERADGGRWLELTLGAGEHDDATVARYLAEAETLSTVAAGKGADRSPRSQVTGLRADSLEDLDSGDLDEWSDRVDEIRAAIARGAAEKIVAAREVSVRCPGVDVAALLEGLGTDMPECLLFGFAVGDATFLGASPERLIARQGTRIRTHALAGSIRPGTNGRGVQAATLFESAKDRSEHRFVVDHLVERLRPWCRELSWPEEPQVQELRNVLHLDSPIVGELASPRHVLSLVAALHPTPAVGGVPATLAQQWITQREPAPRGWYSGPVGWFDEAGDGDFSVAIRSGLVSGDEVRLYSGAGIVADSEAGSEHDETELKLAPLRSLLSCDESAVD